jgi:hypothetical protein
MAGLPPSRLGYEKRTHEIAPKGDGGVRWADHAPALAGLPGFTDAQAEKVLEDGTGPNGEPPRSPMLTYHMSPADARAIVAYLRSLPTEVH